MKQISGWLGPGEQYKQSAATFRSEVKNIPLCWRYDGKGQEAKLVLCGSAIVLTA